jgi:hypothetical protein
MGDLSWTELIGARLLGDRPLSAKRRSTQQLGPPASVQHLQFAFRRWEGPIGDWKDHFGKGKGQVHSLDGTEPLRSCNEVEVAKRLGTLRNHAFWFSEYNPTSIPPIWRPWARSLRAEPPSWLASLDRTIRQHVSSKKGGMPDVVAWNDDESLHSAIFIECKGHREAFSEAQEDWVWAARNVGVELSQLAVSLRPF